MRLGILALVMSVSILLVSACTDNNNGAESRMPVSTKSELARELYEAGTLAFDQIKYELAYDSFKKAVEEDEDFFMAHFWLYFMSHKSPKGRAEWALNTGSDLNEAEREIKTAFKYIVDGQDEKVVEHLKMAVDLYPQDPHLHKILYIFQFQFQNDVKGAVESMEEAIRVRPEYPLVYNQLGYAWMYLEEFDKAEHAFDTYIRLSPDIANPYDSKGDYYMATEQYESAYESYKKAYALDSGFTISAKKAKKAKILLEESYSP